MAELFFSEPGMFADGGRLRTVEENRLLLKVRIIMSILMVSIYTSTFHLELVFVNNHQTFNTKLYLEKLYVAMKCSKICLKKTSIVLHSITP